MSITISSRIPNDIVKSIDNIAQTTERSRSYHIKKALVLYCSTFDKVQNQPSIETQNALNEMQNKKGKKFANVDELFADLDN